MILQSGSLIHFRFPGLSHPVTLHALVLSLSVCRRTTGVPRVRPMSNVSPHCGRTETPDIGSWPRPQKEEVAQSKINADVAAPFMSEFAQFEGRH